MHLPCHKLFGGDKSFSDAADTACVLKCLLKVLQGVLDRDSPITAQVEGRIILVSFSLLSTFPYNNIYNNIYNKLSSLLFKL